MSNLSFFAIVSYSQLFIAVIKNVASVSPGPDINDINDIDDVRICHGKDISMVNRACKS